MYRLPKPKRQISRTTPAHPGESWSQLQRRDIHTDVTKRVEDQKDAMNMHGTRCSP